MTKRPPSPAFWDRVAHRYAKMAIRNPQPYEATLRLVKKRLQPDHRVLELGCGTGSTALRLAPFVAHYTATDFSTEMIVIAKDAQRAAGIENLDACVAHLGDAAMQKGPFDVVLAFNVLHLLPDRSRAFSDIAGLLAPQGLFISKTPCLGGVFRVFQPVLAVLRLFGKAPAFAFLSTSKLERDISKAGFKIIEQGNYPARPPRRFIVAQKI